MKISKDQLQQIIKEEFHAVLKEQIGNPKFDGKTGKPLPNYRILGKPQTFRSMEAGQHVYRTVAMVDTPQGPVAMYKSSGTGTPGGGAGGMQGSVKKGAWTPYYGLIEDGHYSKGAWDANGNPINKGAVDRIKARGGVEGQNFYLKKAPPNSLEGGVANWLDNVETSTKGGVNSYSQQTFDIDSKKGITAANDWFRGSSSDSAVAGSGANKLRARSYVPTEQLSTGNHPYYKMTNPDGPAMADVDVPKFDGKTGKPLASPNPNPRPAGAKFDGVTGERIAGAQTTTKSAAKQGAKQGVRGTIARSLGPLGVISDLTDLANPEGFYAQAGEATKGLYQDASKRAKEWWNPEKAEERSGGDFDQDSEFAPKRYGAGKAAAMDNIMFEESSMIKNFKGKNKMKISKDQLKRIIKEEMDDASAHTIATGGETIENPKMPTGFGHYAGKGRYEDWNTAGSGDRAREEDLESIRLAGDIGEKPEPQQRYDISDETGVPVLRSDLDDALTSLSKDQVEQIIREAVSAMEEQSAYGKELKGGHGGDPNVAYVDSMFADNTRSKVRNGVTTYSSDATKDDTVITGDYTSRDRQASHRATGEDSTFESTYDSLGSQGERASSERRSSGDTKSSSFTGGQDPAFTGDRSGWTRGREASITRTDPLGLKGVEQTTSTITVDDVELKPGDKGYFAAQEKLNYPGLPEAGETGEDRNFVKTADVSALDETFKRWKKLIK